MLTGEVKQRLVQVLTEVVERHRKARAAVTDEVFNIYNIIRAFHMFFKKGRYFFYIDNESLVFLFQMVDAFMAVRPLPNMFN